MRMFLSAIAVVFALTMAQANAQQVNTQQAANNSSGRITRLAGVGDFPAHGQPAGAGNRRETLSPGQRQTFERDYASPAGIGCGLLCRAGIQ